MSTTGRYQVGIALGTTHTTAAVCRAGHGQPEIVPLAGARVPLQAVVYLGSDDRLLVGDAAARRALTEPGRVVREFMRRIGDPTPLLVGGRAVAVEAVAARYVAWILDEISSREGGRPDGIVLTHPAGWGPHKRRRLAAAFAEEGIPQVTFLDEPRAAAIASADRLGPDAVAAVYDLGGVTFDAAVVRATAEGPHEIVGRPTGIERLGGVDFDQLVLDHVARVLGPAWLRLEPADPAVQAAVVALRSRCTSAKEALSTDVEVTIPVTLPGLETSVRLARAEFEEMIRPGLAETVEALRRAIIDSGVRTEAFRSILLAGGSARIPLVAELLSRELHVPVATELDPGTVIVNGAALHARDLAPPIVVVPEPTQETSSPPRASTVDVSGPDGGRPAPSWATRVITTAAASLVAVVALSATAATGTLPLGAEAGAPQAAAQEPGGTAIDPWTGEVFTPTTPPGPKRPSAVAATARPAPRHVSTGARGAATVAAPGVSAETGPGTGSGGESGAGGSERGVTDSGGPDTTDPGSSDPGTTDPGTTDPGTIDPGTTDPGTTDPGTTDPGTTDPGTTDPGTTDPGTTDPGTTDPGTTDPGTTDPGTTDPGTTDPGTSDPATGSQTTAPAP